MKTILITSLIASCFAVLGYFGRRWLEQRGKDESLNRAQKILEIHKQLKEQDLSPEDLKNIENLLLGRAERNFQKKTEPTPLEKEFSKRGLNHRLTQIEMNALAADKLIEANGDLVSINRRIKEAVNTERFNQFRSAQELWEQLCEETAAFVSSKYKGGSILPYIYLIERERLVRERITQLERLLDNELRP